MVLTAEFKLDKLPPGVRVPAPIFQRNGTKGVVAISNIMKATVVRATPKVTTTTSLGWQTIVPQVRPKRVIGGVIISGGAGDAAVTLEKGAKPHFPPVPSDPEGEPALGAWLRNVRDFAPFVEEDGVERPMNPGNIRDVRKVAFKIGAAIRSRGLPRPGGRGIKIFTKALNKIQGQIDAAMERMVDLIVLDLGKG